MSRKNSGRRPPKDEAKQMRAAGYETIGKIAKLLKVSPSTVYTWASGWEYPDKAVGASGNVWVAVSAAQAKRPRISAMEQR